MVARDRAVDLLRQGRFQDALSTLKEGRQASAPHELSIAEALLRVGKWSDATNYLDRLIRTGSPAAKAAALGLRAELKGYRAESEAAEAEFRDAVRLAVSAGDRRLAAILRIRMLAFVGEVYADSRTDRIAAEARDDAFALGDEQLLAAYHAMAAKHEATRGALAAASTHEQLAEQHLRRRPNAWILAGLMLSKSGNAFLRSDFDTALRCSLEAEQQARRSGDLWSRAAAASNLGSIYLYTGRLHLAERELLRARELGAQLPVLQVGSVDGWAQLCLLKSKPREAERAIADVEAIIHAHPALNGSWYELGSKTTKVRLLRSEARWQELITVARGAVALAKDRRDANAAAYFLCSCAEALLACGNLGPAAEALTEALLTVPSTLAVRVERHRVRAIFHAAEGQGFESKAALASAERLAIDAGDAVAQHDVGQTRAMLSDTRSTAGHPTDEIHSTASLGLLSALLDAVDRPRVVAVEALLVLRKLDLITNGAVIVDDGIRRSILEADGWRAEQDDANQGVVEVPVTSSVKLIVRSKEGIEARHAISGFKSFFQLTCGAEGRPGIREPLWGSASYEVSPASAFTSRAMSAVLATAERIAGVDVTVLLTGETGVGKEVLAKTIHDKSPRAKAPFVPFNCSAIPREMLESQLFGYRRGAFTGALEAFSGVIRAAEPGTLFLDEVGDLPLDLQPKLLRFLEASEVHPLGEPRPIRVNVRVIAATNADLTARIKHHQFREDLYYRLNTIQIDIPPLRRRTEEIPQLARTLLAAHAEEFRKGRLQLADDVLERLLAYEWPGNIRELSNEMRRLAALAEPDSVVDTDLLADRILGTSRPAARKVPAADLARVTAGQPLPQAISALEKTMIERALQMSDGKVDEAARMLGISRKGLFLKRKRYGISS